MEFHVDDSGRGQRLDHFLQGKLPEFSRSRLQEWVKAGRVRVDGGAAKASLVLKGGADWGGADGAAAAAGRGGGVAAGGAV